MTRTREDVWTLTRAEGDWPETLVAYEKAVALLRERDPADGPPVEPLGWRFLAAIHGFQGPGGGADTSNALWSNCQHGSWFFLPWHRMYLMAFELAIQDALDDDEWALPTTPTRRCCRQPSATTPSSCGRRSARSPRTAARRCRRCRTR
jgi:tyrosinase